MKTSKTNSILYFVFVLFFIPACGFLDSKSQNLDNNSHATFVEYSTDEKKTTNKVKDNKKVSRNKCEAKNDCKAQCSLMLYGLADQSSCYKLSESKVTELIVVYDKIQPGADDLDSIEHKEMENFLQFSSHIWRDTINGFERNSNNSGRCKELKTQTTKFSEDDINDIERKCEYEHYDRQLGYSRRNAIEALQWIIESSWIHKMLKKYDKNNNIVKSLREVIINGGRTNILSEADKSLDELYGNNIQEAQELLTSLQDSYEEALEDKKDKDEKCDKLFTVPNGATEGEDLLTGKPPTNEEEPKDFTYCMKQFFTSDNE